MTHNANVAVLGDADHITKLENHPVPEGGRHCRPGVIGTFEVPDVTTALLELEGGERAFQYRLRRYSLPKTAKVDSDNLLRPGEVGIDRPVQGTAVSKMSPRPGNTPDH